MFGVHRPLISFLFLTAVFCNAQDKEAEKPRTTRTPAVLFVDVYTLQTGVDYRQITTKQRPSTTITSSTQRPRRQGPSSRFFGSLEYGDIEQRLAGVFRNSSVAGKSSPESRIHDLGKTEEVTEEVHGQTTVTSTETVAGESFAETPAVGNGLGEVFSIWFDPGEADPGEIFPGEALPRVAVQGEDRAEEGDAGEDRLGGDRAREDRPGEDHTGEDRPGEDRPGEDRTGEDRPGEDRPGEDRPGEDRPGEDRPGEDRPGEDRPGEALPRLAVLGEDRPGEIVPIEDVFTVQVPGQSSPLPASTPAYDAFKVQLSSTFIPTSPDISESTAVEVPGIPVISQSKKPRKPTFDEVDAFFIPEIDDVTTILSNKTWFDKLFDLSDVYQRINRSSRTFHKVSTPGEAPATAPEEDSVKIPGEVLLTSPGELHQQTATTIGNQLLVETTVGTVMSDFANDEYEYADSNTTSELEIMDDLPVLSTEVDIKLSQHDSTTITESTEINTTPNVVTTTSPKKRTNSTAAFRVGSANTVPFFADSPTLRFFQENCAAIVGGIVGLVVVIVGCYIVCQRRYRSGRMTVCRATIDWQISDMKPRRQPLLFSPTMETPLTTVEMIPDCGTPECIVEPRRLTTFVPTPPPLPKLH